MTTLKLIPDPTFRARVPIPVPGKGEVPVEFEFKHMRKSEFEAFLSRPVKLADVDYVMHIAKGWELADDWNKKNVGALLNSYGGAARAIARRYIEELTGVPLPPQE